MVIGLKEVRVSSSNLVPSLSTKNRLLSLSALFVVCCRHASSVRYTNVLFVFMLDKHK